MNREILVTGASKGIGRAIATRLASDGFGIVVHYGHDHAGAEETLAAVRECGVAGRLLSFDLVDRAECRLRLDADITKHGIYYGIVLNAGIARDNAFPALADDDWDSVLTTNVTSMFRLARAVAPGMISRRGGAMWLPFCKSVSVSRS